MASGENRPEIRKRLKERRQRQREVLAAYAVRPLAESTLEFCKRIDVPIATFRTWTAEDPWFSPALREIQDQRAQFAIDPIRTDTEAFANMLYERAMAGDPTCTTIVAKMLGLLSDGRPTVVNNIRTTTNVGIGMIGDGPESGTEEELEELVQDHQRVRALIVRRIQSLPSPEADPGDPGPEANGGGPPAGS